MNKRTYNLIYAIYFLVIGSDKEYEDAILAAYEQFALEMLERIQESLSNREAK